MTYDYTSFPAAIDQLLAERDAQAAALAAIDEALARAARALDGTATAPDAPSEETPAAPRLRQRRVRGKFTRTGDESILAFVGAKKGAATGAEIERHWKNDGRGGAAASALTKLVAAGTLTRTRLTKGRGSTYAIA